MPIYEYRCEHCGEFEEMQRITAPPLTHCPKCRRRVRRLISHTSFQLKGSGWYVTDYARRGAGDDAKGGTAESASTGGEKPASDPKSGAADGKASDTPAKKPASGGTSEKPAS